jgi:diguanylate cyclase (GGDEF)-like protein
MLLVLWLIREEINNMKNKKILFMTIFFSMIIVQFTLSYSYGYVGENRDRDLEMNQEIENQSKDIIIIGDDANYPPYSFLDKNGNPAGFNIDLAREALGVMGLKAEFKLSDWNVVRKNLENGKIHMISGMVYSEEREKIYNFTTRHTITNGEIFTRRGKEIKDIKELKGLTVVVQEGGIVHEYLADQNLHIEFVKVATIGEALKLVSMGTYDYGAVLKVPGNYIINEHKLENLQGNGIDVAKNNYTMAVQKNNEDLLFTLNDGLKILKDTGKYEEIYDKWLGVYEEKRLLDEIKEYSWLIGLIILVLIVLIMGIFILRRIVEARTKELTIVNKSLRENEIQLNEYNEEMAAAYEQLIASEEALRDQYDEIERYTEKLEKLKQKYQIAIKGTDSVVWEYNLEDRTIYLSEEVKNTYGIDINEEEHVDEILDEFFNKEEKEKLKDEFKAYEEGHMEEIHLEVKLKGICNNVKWILIRGKGVFGETKNLKVISGIILDITKLKEKEKCIEHLAYHDVLTNLPNRLKFMGKLNRQINESRPGAIMLLDIDNFKEINDILGHVYGDEVLKKVAKELIKIQDEKLFISRFGGDEFLILIEGEDDVTEIENYAKEILDVLKKRIIIGENQIHISCSIGITLYPFDSNDVNQIIINADVAMYRVKNLGKSNYMFFNSEMANRVKEKIKIEQMLRKAIEEDGFKVLYQPQVCVLTGEIVGYEALLRMKEYTLSPAVFIPAAEETSMIMDIGRIVAEKVIKQIGVWKKKGLNIKPIAINFSAKQLNDLGYIDFLQDILEKAHVETKYIDIEITESVFLEKKDETIEFLNRLKALGIGISLDDFGTGYSSLSYLTFLPVDKIKLDKSLNDKFLELKNISVMDSIISLAHSLNLKVVAEGIEDMEQYKRLKVGKCDYIQGYVFSKPLEVNKVEEIHNHNFLNMP